MRRDFVIFFLNSFIVDLRWIKVKPMLCDLINSKLT